MKLSTGLLSLGAVCGLLAVPPIGVHAQTLPVTAGLQLWLNADTGITTNASGQVTAWTDQSGAGNHAAQPTAASAPTLAANSLNGHATVRFDSPQFMEVPNANAIAELTNDVTILTVAKYDNLSSYRGVLSKCVGGVPAPFDWWNNQSVVSGRTRLTLANAGLTPGYRAWDSIIRPPPGVFNVLGFRWKDGQIDQFLNEFNNGNVFDPTVTLTNGSTNLRIGKRQDNTVVQLIGNVAEILIYKPALSDPDYQNVVKNYLQPKYALAFNAAANVTITSPTNGASLAPGTVFPVAFTATDPDGAVTSVSVYANGALVGTATSTTSATNTPSYYQVNLRGSSPGTLTLTAMATDNYGQPSTSAPVALTITGTVPTSPLAGGLKVWLTADAGVTVGSGGAVTRWADQSGAGNDAVQSDEASAPKLAANAVNGKPALRFNGTPQFLEVSDEGTAFTTNDFTTFAVVKFVGAYFAQRQQVWSKCSGAGWAGPVDWWLNTTTGAPYGYRGDGTYYAGVGGGLAGPALGLYSVLGMMVTGADGMMAHSLGFLDNGSSVALTNTASAGLPLRIGRRADGGAQTVGDIAEVLIYDQALSASDRSNVVAYLSGKYNLIQTTNVSPAPVVSIVAPTNGTAFTAPATSVNFVAGAASSNGVIARVTLAANGVTYATLTNAPFQVPLDFLTPGTVTLTATVQDNWGLTATTSVVVTVTGSGSAPLPATGLMLQLAADLGVTVDSTNGVTSWVDQTANGNNAAPTDNGLPTLVAGALSGKPVIRFTNNPTAANQPKQSLDVTPANLGFMAGDCSAFVLAKFATMNAYRTILSKTAGNNIGAPRDWYLGNNANALSTVVSGDGTAATGHYTSIAASNATPTGLFNVLGFSASSSTLTHFLGYNLSGGGTVSAPVLDAGSAMRIGRRADNGTLGNYDVAEILLFDHAVSDSERRAILDYLYYKWGIVLIQLANMPPKVTLLSPTSDTPTVAPGVLSIVAQVSDPDTPISRVDFTVNGTTVASRTAAPYQIPLQLLTPGSLTIRATAVDFWGASKTSDPVTVTVSGRGPAAPPAPGQVLWLKADAGVTTNADGTVAVWADQSGNTNHAVQDLSQPYQPPMFVTDTNTGLPALNYDGVPFSPRYLVVPHADILALTNDWSLFYAASFDDFTATRSICGKTGNGLPHPLDYYINTSGQAVVGRGEYRAGAPVNSLVTSSGALPVGSFVVAGTTIQGSLASHFLQGIANGTGQMGYGAIDDGMPLYIGTHDYLDINMKGNLGELILYSRALTGNDLLAANSYLAGRYGIAMFQLSSQPPVLDVAKTGPTVVTLSWLPGYAGFVLEGRADIGGGAWTPLATNPPNNQITITTTNASRFFRLRAQ